MMRAILKLKSDGAQALLTAVLLLGCGLNVMLVLAFMARMDAGGGGSAWEARSVVAGPEAGSRSTEAGPAGPHTVGAGGQTPPPLAWRPS
jgi:hypothetical protein